MDVRSVWEELKKSLIFLSKWSYPPYPDVPRPSHSSFYGIHRPVLWSRDLDAQDVPGHENFRTPTYPFKWNAGPEYDWLTRDYSLQLVLSQSSGIHNDNEVDTDWYSTIHLELRLEPGKTSSDVDPLDFPPSSLTFSLFLSPVTFGGISSTVCPPYSPLTYTFCDGARPKITIPNKFCEMPLNGFPKSQLDETVFSRVQEAIEDVENPAICSMRVETGYESSSLTMEVSYAIASLLRLPAKPTSKDESVKVDITAEKRHFSVSLNHLTAVSTVIEACFRDSNFLASKNHRLYLSHYSDGAVDAFVHFVRFGTVPPNVEAVALELVGLCHQYDMRGLLVICEVYLIRSLMYCSNVGRLGELA